MVDVGFDHEGSGPGDRAQVRVRCSVRGSFRIGFWLHFGFGTDLRATVRLNYSYTVRHG